MVEIRLENSQNLQAKLVCFFHPAQPSSFLKPPQSLHFLFFKNKFVCLFVCLFVYLFMAVLGLCCCVRAFSNCGEQGLLFVVVRRLLIAMASLAVKHGL